MEEECCEGLKECHDRLAARAWERCIPVDVSQGDLGFREETSSPSLAQHSMVEPGLDSLCQIVLESTKLLVPDRLKDCYDIKTRESGQYSSGLPGTGREGYASE